MKTISLQCDITFLLKKVAMIGRAYMGEMLTQVWLKSIN